MPNDVDFWNGIAGKYFARPVDDPESYQAKLEMTAKLLRPDMHLVELGCGTGTTALHHAPNVDHVTAVDFADDMLAYGRDRAFEQGITNIDFVCAPAEKLKLPAGSVDVVLAMSLLHLVQDRAKLLSNIYHLLKPGAAFISSTMCMGDDMKWARYVIPVMALFGKAPDTVNFFTGDALVSEIESVGFVIDKRWKPGKGKAVFLIARKPA